MANKDVKKTKDIIHHSDRGSQYCCTEFVEMTQTFNIRLSMTERGDPYENAIAERVNGILKSEHRLSETFSDYNEAKIVVDEAIKNYNELRIHDSCARLTPQMAHEEKGVLKKYWKPRKYAPKTVPPEIPLP
jgi:transposase InsO family protein